MHARYARIRQDVRHRDTSTFADKSVEARLFPTWQMAFTALPQQPLLELTDYSCAGERRPAAPPAAQTEAHLANLLYLVRPLIIP